MAVASTFDIVGVKEDVDDLISNISPEDTPFLSSIGSDKATQKTFQWQEDALRAPAANAKVEGFTATERAIVPTSLRSNQMQILSETVKVATTVDATDTYGRAKETAYQLGLTMAALKLDLEYAYVTAAQANNTASVTDNTTARVMAGVQKQLLNGGSGSLDSDDFVLYTGGSSTAPTEANYLSLLQHLYTYGAKVNTIMVTPTNSTVVSAFDKAAGRYREIGTGDTKIVNKVDIYVSPFGTQRVVLNRWLKAGNTLFYNPDMWKKVTLRPWSRETLAKDGDYTKVMFVGEFSLKHRNYRSAGMIVEAAGPTGF